MAAANDKSTSDTNLPPGMRSEERRTLSNKVIRDKIFIEKYGAETNGEYTMIHCTVSPGGGSPLHYHTSYAEILTCSDGILGVVLETETLTRKVGEVAKIPAGTKHRFFNPSTDTDMSFIGEVRPSNEGFEKSLYICYGLANDGLCDEKGLPKSLVHLCLIADLGDMSFPGLLATLGRPFIKGVAAYARWSGEEEELLKKYWD